MARLADPGRALFVAAARGRARAADVLAVREQAARAIGAATRSLPRDVAVFTGRQAELRRLMDGLAGASARVRSFVSEALIRRNCEFQQPFAGVTAACQDRVDIEEVPR